jgi:hypothetical protein
MKIRYQDFHGGPGKQPVDRFNSFRELKGPSVLKIIPGHRGDHHMFKAKKFGGLSYPHRLILIDSERISGMDTAKPAVPCTLIPEDHEGRSRLLKTIGYIRTTGRLTDRMELMIPQHPLQSEDLLCVSLLRFQPLRQSFL